MNYNDLLDSYKGNKNSITYNELLNTTEWALKREQIINRDNSTCQVCKKNIIMPNFEKIQITRMSWDKTKDDRLYFKCRCRKKNKNHEHRNVLKTSPYGLNLFDDNKYTKLAFIKAKYFKDNHIPKLEQGIEEEWPCDYEMYGYPFNKPLPCPYINKNGSKIFEIEGIIFGIRAYTDPVTGTHYPATGEDEEAVFLRQLKYLCDNYGYKPQDGIGYISTVNEEKGEESKITSLHVHHKFYIKSRLPWEYEDEDLITYCDHCHHEYHNNNKVKIYIINNNGQKKELLYKPCSRCNGAGWFPQYRHVENGICFSCLGERFILD